MTPREIADSLTPAQRRAVLFPANPKAPTTAWKTWRVYPALERKGVAVPVPNHRYGWRLTQLGQQVREILEQEQGR